MKLVVFVQGSDPSAASVIDTGTRAALSALGIRADLHIRWIGSAPSSPVGATQIEAVSLGFDGNESAFGLDRDRRLADVQAAGAGDADAIGWQDVAWNVITSIAESDAVLILGTESTSYLERGRAHELIALVRLAQTFSKPVVVAGQRLVEQTPPFDRELIADALRSAALVGVVDQESRDQSIIWGVPRASIRIAPLGVALPHTSPRRTSAPGIVDDNGFIVARFDGLDALKPYVDPVVNILERLTTFAPVEDGSTRPVGDASLVISTRMDDVAVALASAIPVIALGVDDRSTAQLAGVLNRVGMSDWALAAAAVGSGDLEAAAADTWTRRSELSAHLAVAAARDAAAERRWWDDVVKVLAGEAIGVPRAKALDVLHFSDSALVRRIAFAREVSHLNEGRWTLEALSLREQLEKVSSTAREVLAAEQLAGELQSRLWDAEDRAAEARAALEAAQSLAAEIADPVFAKALRPPVVPYTDNALDDLLQSRMLRWTRGLRRAYGRARFPGEDHTVL